MNAAGSDGRRPQWIKWVAMTRLFSTPIRITRVSIWLYFAQSGIHSSVVPVDADADHYLDLAGRQETPEALIG
jgi:hypothetical protein